MLSRPKLSRAEFSLFASAFLVAVAGWVGAKVVRAHHPGLDGRFGFGLAHVPGAMVGAGLVTLAAGVLLAFRGALTARLNRSLFFCLAFVVVAFCAYWLPVLLSAGFVQDDWVLLAGATARQSLAAHPHLAWYALDTMDGNFRPLTTVVYMGAMLHAAGLHAMAFAAGNFLACLLQCWVAFLLVRAFGYSNVVGVAAALLFMSRGANYTPVAWPSAMGDASATLFCGLTVLLTLIALRRAGWRAALWHMAAWCSFVLAALSKQSSFVAPLILAGLFLLRPGPSGGASWPRRVATALAAGAAYGAVVLVVAFHAKHLAAGSTPYEVGLTTSGVWRLFFQISCYLLPPPFESAALAGPTRASHLAMMYGGRVLVAGAALMLWLRPKLLGERRRDVGFALFAGFVSIGLLAWLPRGGEAYYTAMAAFWFSIALAIVLRNAVRMTPDSGSWATLLFCALMISGVFFVRLEQTGLMHTGGYVWGDYAIHHDDRLYQGLLETQREHPDTRTIVFVNASTAQSFDESRALLAFPQVQRLLVYKQEDGRFYVNDRNGLRPGDGAAACTDDKAYRWDTPSTAGDSLQQLSVPGTLWIDMRDDLAVVSTAPPPSLLAQR